jgi:hypothetical protein
MTETTLSSPMKRVEDWKSRLIDLSRKNNLLYFHKGKRGNFSITQPDQQKIFESLVIKKNHIDFSAPKKKTKKLKNQNPKAKEKTKISQNGKSPTTPEEKTPHSNQLVSGNLSHGP